MRIAIDLQGIQSEGSRTRGIGRYSLHLVRSLIKYYPSNEYFLVANSVLNDLRLELENELLNDNVFYIEWIAPCPLDYLSNKNNNINIGTLLRSYTFACLYPDVVLVTSFLEGFSDNCLTEFDDDILKVPKVSIFYDLIPLLNKKLYLINNPEFAEYYYKKISRLKDFDGLLAISHSSAFEVISYLDYEKSKVFNISSACDSEIFNTNLGKQILPIQLDIDKPYLLYVGAGDPRKNLKRLIEAFSQLSDELKHFNLVLAGKLLDPEITIINSWIISLNIEPSRVIKIGYVSDEDLVFLYKNCSLFIFPSLHEGFGLPVLEAMSCGAAVIGSNSTSIPEVIGNDRAMFNPEDTESIKNLIELVLLDSDFKEDLIHNSMIQSKKFSWFNTAKNAINALNNITNSKNSHHLDWKYIINHNNVYFQLLLEKIVSNNSLINRFDSDKISLVSSCIDQINYQLESYARFHFKPEFISSWRIEGPLDSNYSLAILNRNFAMSMSSFVDDLSLHVTEGPGDYEPDINYLRKYISIFNLYNDSLNKSTESEVISRNLYPPRVSDLNAQFNLLHSYGWEESSFPSQWVDEFNSYLQGVSVMSNQVKKILIDNGVDIPITVTPLGLDHVDNILNSNDLKLRLKKYRLLHISSCFPRKGIDVLLKSYGRAFTINDDVTLIIKTFNNPHNFLDQIINELKNKNPLFPDVCIIYDDLSEQELKSLYLMSNVYVAPSRGEGFGLPIGEAMKLGLPVITTGWGGQTQFCDSSNSWLIDFQFVKANSHFGEDYSYWAEPSLSHLTKLLREVYELPIEDINSKIKKAKISVDQFTWKNNSYLNKNFVENKLIYKTKKYSKLGIISTWDTRCGIAAYSKHLIDKIPEDVSVFCPILKHENNIENDNVFPTWDMESSHEDFSLLFETIIGENITTLIIQFNYGFFNLERLSDMILRLKNKGIIVIMILHSTQEPTSSKDKKTILIKDAMIKCNRLFVHSIDDLNRLKDFGIVDNVCLFPHGLLDFKSKTNSFINPFRRLFRKNITRIASYGYCLPNKGFEQLILAMDLLIRKNVKIKLDIYSAIYSDSFFYIYEQLCALIRDLDLQKNVSINIEYMSDEETLNILSNYDAIVYPYQSSQESSSASVRNGLATLKPVLVTPSSIFSDVSDLVDYFDGFSPQAIASGLEDWILKKKLDSSSQNMLQTKRIDQIEKLRFSKVSKRLLNILNSLQVNQS